MGDTVGMTPHDIAISKNSDSKGRITLGKEFANGTFLFRFNASSNEITLVPAEVVPKQELWLHENKEAMAMVQEGLADAKAGKFVEGPDLDEAKKLIDKIEASEK